MLPKIREVVASDDWVTLPTKFDIHEWEIMRRFGNTVRDADVADRIDRAIHGRAAFRMFRATIEEAGLLDEWFEFKREALRGIARETLEELNMPYK